MNGPYVVLETEEPGDERDLYHAGSKGEGFPITWTNRECLVALEVVTPQGPHADLILTPEPLLTTQFMHLTAVTGQNTSPGQKQALRFNNEHRCWPTP